MALDGTTAILETQLLPKKELYKRWFGATDEEIVGHFNRGELPAYERYKGPINGVVWCKPGYLYYRSEVDYSNPDLYEYDDKHCDYFLLEYVIQCETEHPEYIGNVTPESLGLTPVYEREYLDAEDLRKELSLSPTDFVKYLRKHHASLPLYGLSQDEMDYFYDNFTRLTHAASMLDDITIHRLDWENFQQRKKERENATPPSEGIPVPAVAADTSELESLLVDTQKQLKDPLHAGLATLSAGEVINRLEITPIEIVDILNGVYMYDDYNSNSVFKRLVTTDEEAFREYANSGLSKKFFNIKSLEEVNIYQADFDRYCETWGIQQQAKPVPTDSTEIEAQLAEAQKSNESLRQWNKRLNEINTEKRAALEEKDAIIT